PDDLPDEGGSDPHAAGAPPAPEPTGTFIRSVGRRDGTSEWRLETPQGTWSGLEETAESGAPVVEPESEEDEEGEEDGGDDLDDADTTTTVAPELGPPPRRAGRPVTAPPEVAPAVAPAAPRRPETTPHLGAPPRLESIIHPSPGRRWARAHLALAAAGLAAVVLVIVALSGSGGSSATTARGEAEEEGEEEGAAAAQVAKAAPAPDEPAEVVLDFAPDPMPPDSDPRPEPEEPERADGPGTDRPAPDSGRRSGRRAGSGAGSRTGSGSGPGSTSASEPKERRARFGTVDIYAEPWADIYLGKKKVGTAPQRGVRLPVGRHRLRLVNPVQQRTAWVTVTVPSSRPVQVTLPERGR
ncbi:MAG TPA: hypothetical protein VKZ63_16205, partial [Kofleriaceae bacterium]|nr:hypothetical protein [Kofleriaceae bacterium]